MPLNIIILAAGKGKRMYSSKPKVLNTIGGQSMLEHVVNTALALQPDGIYVVYGHQGEQIKQALSHLPVHWVHQEQQLGTGHAVRQVLPLLSKKDQILVLSGDVPLLQSSTVKQLIADSTKEEYTHLPLGLLTVHMENPFGFGRILRNLSGSIYSVVEEKDADYYQREIKEVYSGTCCGLVEDFSRWLSQVNTENAQGEYYLTDIIRIAAQENALIISSEISDSLEVAGVNNPEQLQIQERAWQQRIATRLMLSGVVIADASRIDVRGELTCGKDVFIDVNSVFEGQVIIGDGCRIEPNCYLTNVTLAANSIVKANSVLEDCDIGHSCTIGPFARLRPGTILGDHCKIGNFVETKNSNFGENSKANHLSYLGDSMIGKDVNIGAGTITCNYDGANKHKTIIEDGAFIGSDTQLIAPVTVGKNATVGAGSTIRRDVPADELTIIETNQKVIPGWKRPKKQETV